MPAKSARDARILIVDDQEANVRLLEGILRRAAGFSNLRSTTDSREAVTLYSEFQPDLILLDLHMPHLDGFRVMEELKLLIPTESYVPILVLTADITPEAKQLALAGGAKDFLTKPFDPTEVRLRIENLLETRFLYLDMEQRVRARTQELEDAHVEVLERLALAAEYRDDDTGEHTKRVGRISSLLAGAHEVGGSSIVVGMARNGTTFGVRLPGSDEWYLAPSPPVGHALYYSGQGPETSAPDIGDSALLELVGLGGPAAAGSPAVAGFVGGTMADAIRLTTDMDRICTGRSSRFKLALLDFRGTPIAVDVRRVVETGITPRINTGILHVSDGSGQVGAGVAVAPVECFRSALLALDRKLCS